MKRPGGTLLILAGCALATLALAAAATAAGTYQVSACNYAKGINHSWTWISTDPSPTDHYAEHIDCPDPHGGDGGTSDQEGGLATTDALGLSSGAPPASSAAWTSTASPGTTFAGITYERYLGHEDDTSNTWSPALRADGTIVAGETCTVMLPSVGCFLGGPPGEGGEPATIMGLSAHELTFGLTCVAPIGQECVTGATEHAAWAAMYGTTLTINDPTPPTLNTPSGTLWGPGEPNGYHKGTETATVSAQDLGGGVQSIILSADGHPIETYKAPCDFTFLKPCPASTEPQTLTLPTTELADGSHTLTLVAIDAAGNESVAASKEIAIDNNPPQPPVGLAATPTQAGSSTFVATWTDPVDDPAPITAATYQICPTSGSGACSTPAAAPAAGPATVTVPSPGTWTLEVWLTDAAGNSSATTAADTTLSVPTTDTGGGSSSGGSDSSGPGGGTSGGNSPSGGGSSPKQAALHVNETLRGRELLVHVSGPTTGKVRVSITGRIRGRTVASDTKTAALKRARLTVIFKLGPHTAAHAAIEVKASLGHDAAATSTLHRHPTQAGKRDRAAGFPFSARCGSAEPIDRPSGCQHAS